jgi:hypothetical protein
LLPIYTPDGRVRGHVARIPWLGTEFPGASIQPKSITYKSEEGPLLSWYRGKPGDDTVDIESRSIYEWPQRLVIVEDQISAMRVAQDKPGCDAVALLGTALNAEKISEIQAQHSRVIIALDADATRIAFQHARRWASAFESFRVVILTKDIKDLSKEEIHALPF